MLRVFGLSALLWLGQAVGVSSQLFPLESNGSTGSGCAAEAIDIGSKSLLRSLLLLCSCVVPVASQAQVVVAVNPHYHHYRHDHRHYYNHHHHCSDLATFLRSQLYRTGRINAVPLRQATYNERTPGGYGDGFYVEIGVLVTSILGAPAAARFNRRRSSHEGLPKLPNELSDSLHPLSARWQCPHRSQQLAGRRNRPRQIPHPEQTRRRRHGGRLQGRAHAF